MSPLRQVCDVRWKIEQFHREAKQLTGLEKCQCRLPRLSHWIHLIKASEKGQTLYQVKQLVNN